VARTANEKVMALLLEAGANVNERGCEKFNVSITLLDNKIKFESSSILIYYFKEQSIYTQKSVQSCTN
jgi:hypothetical protein